jgi:hypothetical protein
MDGLGVDHQGSDPLWNQNLFEKLKSVVYFKKFCPLDTSIFISNIQYNTRHSDSVSV